MHLSTRAASLVVGAALTAVALFFSPAAAATESNGADRIPERAVWAPKSVHFVFQGFTTHYSCEGLAEKVRKALLDLGATEVRVTEGACTRPGGGPEPFPNVDVKMKVLEPVRSIQAEAHTPTVPAHWKTIDLRLDRDPLWQAEDCELLEQIHHVFLPLFATRNVDYHSSCVAHQVEPGGTWLRAQVLVPEPKEGRPVAAR